MLRLTILAAALAYASAALYDRLIWEECADGKSIVQVNSVGSDPYPPTIPGDLKLNVDLELKQDLKDLDVNVTIWKINLGSFRWKVPCVANVGSCYYADACSSLDEFFKESGCPAEVTALGVPCMCPMKAQKIVLKNQLVTIPELPAAFSWLVAGDYNIRLELRDSTSKKMVSCANVKISINKKQAPCTGWLCNRR